MNKVWYASSGKWFTEEGEPVFFKPNDFKWATDIENNWAEIKPEVQNLIKETDKRFTSNSICRFNQGRLMEFVYISFLEDTFKERAL